MTDAERLRALGRIEYEIDRHARELRRWKKLRLKIIAKIANSCGHHYGHPV